ncbi:MAG: hypothetical protein PHW60_00680 [Kiritimatiellae bacterium]|nr:hypothetical protein [Kiritimatiellia bacterium]
MPTIETVPYRGWKRTIRLTNGQVELIVTQDVGPRIVRFGFVGGQNVFGELPEQMGGTGEKEWMIRGGHRLWVAPEEKPKSYELDNAPVEIRKIPAFAPGATAGRPGGIRAVQSPGSLTHVQKTMDITLARHRNEVTVVHRLTNKGRAAITLAPWALTVMAKRGVAIIPLPKKVPHADCFTPAQTWSLWSYTDLSDPRWTIGPRYILFRQDPKRAPNKIGLAHREGWVAYWRQGLLFIKSFSYRKGAHYPDGGVNFETYSNQRILELESLGPLVTLRPGQTATHTETWMLYRGVTRLGKALSQSRGACRTEADIEKYVERHARG